MPAYLSEVSDDFITINAASTGSRRARASSVNALRRWVERETGVKLICIGEPAYSETHGFLSSTRLRYRVYRGRHRSSEVTSGPTDYVGRH